ncbi:MAG TPA: hypothetical protein VJT74_14055 [Pyrinomonadaceae bacterium]|nr:hypothetical protein [Pyrinomonadaceae bacterium]
MMNPNPPEAAAPEDWGAGTRPVVRIALEPFGEREKFQLAKWILLAIAILFASGAGALYRNPTNAKEIFEACKTVLPPIATLVIGYYFSEKTK